MTEMVSVTKRPIFIKERPRNVIQPTQIQIWLRISRIRFPWNPTKIFIPGDSAQKTESDDIFW